MWLQALAVVVVDPGRTSGCPGFPSTGPVRYPLYGSQRFGHHDIVLGAHSSATLVWDKTDNEKQK